MVTQENQSIQNLLTQVSLISKKYEDLAVYSGEHYNVFDILGITSDELSHSAILTNLLNANGRHGQKDIFLKLFIETVKDTFQKHQAKLDLLTHFNTINSKAEKEKSAGKVNYEAEQGGRIDIVINDGKNNIIIENKVYAGDQPMQLIRYREFDINAPIFYLTLDGNSPSENSKGRLKEGFDFTCISYKNEIVVWIEKCIKEMANKPFIRETLNQYLILIQQLTNQSNNHKMSEEISKILTASLDTFNTSILIANSNNKKYIFENQLLTLINEVKHELKLEINVEYRYNKDPKLQKWFGYNLINKVLFEKGLNITIEFEGFDFIYYGFSNVNNENHELSNQIRDSSKKYFNKNILKQTGGWPAFVFAKNKGNDFYRSILNNEFKTELISYLNFIEDYLNKEYNLSLKE